MTTPFKHRAETRNRFSTTAMRQQGSNLPSHDFRKVRTIPRDTNEVRDPGALALSALGWVLADDIRAERFLALTGLTPDALRTGLGESTMQCAVLEFLGAHEPDLVAAADALAVPPRALIAARDELSGGSAAS